MHLYDVTRLAGAQPSQNYQDPNHPELYYYVKLCGEITKDDLPDYAQNMPGYSSVVCNSSAGRCYPLANKFAYDYRFLDATHFEYGFEYHAVAQPFRDMIQIQNFEVVHSFLCDEQQKDDRKAPEWRIEEFVNDKKIYLNYRTHRACPVDAPLPAPTPDYKPDCLIRSRSTSIPDKGVDMNLANFNDGPYGLRTNVTLNGANYWLFYQACERSKCPLPNICGTEEWSSAWLCSDDMTSCESYGLAPKEFDFSLDPAQQEFGGLFIPFTATSGKEIEVHYKCESDAKWPQGHFNFEGANPQLVGNKLKLTGYNTDVCIKDMPAPVPPQPQKCQINATSLGYRVLYNMIEYNHDNGYVKEVKVDRGIIKRTTLMYQPCGGIRCPDDAYCNGDEDSTVFLCIEDADTPIPGIRRECISFGSINDDITLNLYSSSIHEGLEAGYFDPNGRTAKVFHKCNHDLTSGTIILPETVSQDDNKMLTFTVESLGACSEKVGPTPAPAPQFYPAIPTPGVTPIPTPHPSPNPVFFFTNDTHYIHLNLDRIQQEASVDDVILAQRGKTALVKTHFHPFKRIGCPYGYECFGYDKANFYTCWTDEKGKNVCWAVGDTENLVDVMVPNPPNLDEGLMIQYNGALGVNAEVQAFCDRSDTPNLNLHNRGVYQWSNDNLLYKFTSEASSVCAWEFVDPLPPRTRTPTPVPSPNPNIKYSIESKVINGQKIALDLSKIATGFHDVVIGASHQYQKVKIYFSPTQRVPCPDGYSCPGYEATNAWKCYTPKAGGFLCYPIGDARHALKMEMIDEENLMAGISVNYEGGLANSEISFQFQCNYSVPANQITLDEIGSERIAMTGARNIVVYAHTSAVCPQAAKPKDDGISGGAVFLIIIIVAVVLYLGFFVTYDYVTKGTLGLPHQEFWREFGACVSTGFRFVVSCGKVSTVGDSSYNEI